MEEGAERQNDDNGLPFILNGYKFIKRIGAGASSEVYEVICLKYNMLFAAKVTPLTQDMVDSQGRLIDNELTILISVIDPNIIKIFNYFIEENFLVIILEYCQQGTVLDWLETHKKFPLNSLPVFIQTIASSLSEIHKMKIAHRDLKPGNIFLDKYGRPKIGDFGLSSILSTKDDRAKSACGTECYAAPEIFGGRGYNPYKADVYALGITLYQMATGELPWKYGSRRGEPIIFPEDFDPCLQRLISAMTDPNPNNRPTMNDISHSQFVVRPRKRLSYQQRPCNSSIIPGIIERPSSKYMSKPKAIYRHAASSRAVHLTFQ